MKPRVVEFRGDWYWFIPGDGPESGTIAPLEHCDIRGNVLPEFLNVLAFAEVKDGRIIRYGLEIGAMEELCAVD